MSRIPSGWTYLTTELTSDAAWRTAIDHKHVYERIQNSTLVRVKVIHAGGAFWILRRIERRPMTQRPTA